MSKVIVKTLILFIVTFILVVRSILSIQADEADKLLARIEEVS